MVKTKEKQFSDKEIMETIVNSLANIKMELLPAEDGKPMELKIKYLNISYNAEPGIEIDLTCAERLESIYRATLVRGGTSTLTKIMFIGETLSYLKKFKLYKNNNYILKQCISFYTAFSRLYPDYFCFNPKKPKLNNFIRLRRFHYISEVTSANKILKAVEGNAKCTYYIHNIDRRL